MGSAEGEPEEAIGKGPWVEAADAFCGEGAVDHSPRAGQQVVQRRTEWAEHQHVPRREKVRPTNRGTEEEKPKQIGC